MNQFTMCLKCFEPVQRGWQHTHHIRTCNGRPGATNFREAKTTQQHKQEDQRNEEPSEVNAPDNSQLAVEDEDIHEGAIMPTDGVERKRTNEKLRLLLTPKTKEIVEFLRTAEMGEGCSREHAQGWLDYHKKKGSLSAQ